MSDLRTSMRISSAFLKGATITPRVPWWINSSGVSPVHPVDGNYPYLYDSDNYYDTENHTYKLTGYFQNNTGTLDVGINAFELVELFRGYNNHYDIVLVDSNNDYTSYYLRIEWEDSQNYYEEEWIPQVSISLYYGKTLLARNSNYYYLETDNIQHAYFYAGADTFPLEDGMASPVAYAGFACIDTDNWVYHGGGAIDLDWIEQTYGVHLGSPWLTTS